MQNNCKLVWIDKQINNYENTFFQKRLKDKIQDCSFLDSTSEALKILLNQQKGDKFIKIISGQFIYEEKLDLGDNLIVFCGQSKKHLQQFLSKKELLVLVDSGIVEVEEIVNLNEEFLIAKEYLHQSFDQKAQKQTQYYHQFEATSFRFLLINKKLEKNYQTNEELMEKEILQFVSQDVFKNCQAKMQEAQKNKKNGGKFSIFEKFIYYYTGKEIYRELNRNFAESNYSKLEQIMCVLFEGYSKLQSKPLSNNILYRGISDQEQEIYNNIIQDLQQSLKNNQSMFWNTLASTSTKENVARCFCNKRYKILFEITLNQQNPHPYFVIETYHSQYPNEGEVILFPQFEFKVVDMYNKDNIQYVKVEQVNNNFSMSLDNSKRQKYWTNKIENDLKPKLKKICSFYQIRIDYIIKNIMQFSQDIDDLKALLKNNLEQYLRKLVSLLSSFYNDNDDYYRILNQLLETGYKEINSAFIKESDFFKKLSKFIRDVSDLLIDQFLKIIQKIFNIEEYKEKLITLFSNCYDLITHCASNQLVQGVAAFSNQILESINNFKDFKNFNPKQTFQIKASEAGGQVIGATIVDALNGKASFEQLALKGIFMGISSISVQFRQFIWILWQLSLIKCTLCDQNTSHVEKAILFGKQAFSVGVAASWRMSGSSIGGTIGAAFGPAGIPVGAFIGGIIGGATSQLAQDSLDNFLNFKIKVSFSSKNKSIKENGVLISLGVNPQVEFKNVPDKVQNLVIVCKANKRVAWLTIVKSSISIIQENQLGLASLYAGPNPDESDITFHAFGLETNDINTDSVLEDIHQKKYKVICCDTQNICE
ncbi:unnamed protein product (macronuclear) [Paramecium tetraurelia]|uniref:NAD(+)--protein-arginine ADP-ribosyltransferase n=1 Tax=Paramecium tetraurelia TaxID=5888 RepID=A0CZL6_PARTE|nr:uncharacterized protein GSPATT00011806001 [Paramecium tetraurelia]CAK76233.1 unnamed protein product [Paramecium tetraurelia]|eukprot:XP_001443630.1 hypothetical protein (macronuclear) [Paramecium tetraurelia strain d4-2]